MSEKPGGSQQVTETRSARSIAEKRFVQVQAGMVTLDGNLSIPENASGLVIFVHGSGSSRSSPRNRYVADKLNDTGLATLLFDLLTPEEEELDLRTHQLRFDINLLAERTIAAADWLNRQAPTRHMRLGFFGASTGAAAAIIAGAERRDLTGAIVSRGGRPDLAGRAIPRLAAPTLFIVGQLDEQVLQLNKQALAGISADTPKELIVVPGATHLFEEAGALEYIARLARDWFGQHLGGAMKMRDRARGKARNKD